MAIEIDIWQLFFSLLTVALLQELIIKPAVEMLKGYIRRIRKDVKRHLKGGTYMWKTEKDYWMNAFFIFIIAVVVAIMGHLTGIKSMLLFGVAIAFISGIITIVLWILWSPKEEIPEQSIEESTTKEHCCDENCDCNKPLPPDTTQINSTPPTKEDNVQQADSVQDTQTNQTI